MKKPLGLLSPDVVECYGYDQGACYYSMQAYYKKLRELKESGYNVAEETPKVEFKTWNDVKEGDTVYSVSVGKLIEYEVTKVEVRNVEVMEYKYGSYTKKGKHNMLFITYRPKTKTKTSVLILYKQDALSDSWCGLSKGEDWYPIFSKTPMLYPSSAECAAMKQMFAGKDACMYYLQALYEERMNDVREARREINKKLRYANEYTPVLEEWGWKKPEENEEIKEYEGI